MNHQEIEEFFSNMMEREPGTSAGIAAIRTLLRCLESDKAGTVQELYENLKDVINVLRNTDYSTPSITSGSELFMRFITLVALEKPLAECKQDMIQRGRMFLQKLSNAKGKISKSAAEFITDGCRVLTHSQSRVVLEAMREARKMGRRFEVYVTKAFDESGKKMFQELAILEIPCTVIVDAAIAYVMENVDVVMVGAEGVMESGGVVNKLGTLTMAVCAKEMHKPVYVLTESFKFARMFPLNQRDLPKEFKYPASCLDADLRSRHPLVDYTPPGYVTLLFTDLGVLTPSAVSDELIKLYL